MSVFLRKVKLTSAPAHPVVITPAAALPVGDKGSEVGSGQNISLETEDRVVVSRLTLELIGLNVQEAQIEGSHPAGDLCPGHHRNGTSVQRQADSPGEKHLQ